MTTADAGADPSGRAYPPGKHPDLPPPPGTAGALGWLRQNLFSGPFNSLLTLLSLALLWWFIPPVIEWMFVNATWVGDSRAACSEGGACWALIYVRWEQWLFGFYHTSGSPLRPILAFIGLLFAAAPLLFTNLPHRERLLKFAYVYPVIAYWLLTGDTTGSLFFAGLVAAIFGAFSLGARALGGTLGDSWEDRLRQGGALAVGGVVAVIASYILSYAAPYGDPLFTHVSTTKWGGLMLTLVVGVTGIVVSLPVGIVLALGRRSHMPAVRLVCIAFIEIIRGVPLITLLFMASNMLPLFLPEGVNFEKLLRALIVVALFASAYMAEVIRGGLQAIPNGQYEAADALGLPYWRKMRLVILPQALKIVIPGIVNTFIGLFKDTSLVLIIGLFDLLGIAKAAITDANWIGLDREAFVSVGIIYFIFCFSMSRYSLYLEKRLHTGHKR